jgi:large subunit ribosomal protein L23
MPTTFTNIQEIALKTIPSATKIEIKRVLESLYGFEVEKVRTLNMDGKKKKRGGILIAKPDYKKAYVTLKNPLSIDPNLYPIRVIEEDKKNLNKQAMASLVEEAPNKCHWLDENKERFKPQNGYNRGRFDGSGSNRERRGRVERSDSNRSGDGSGAKFPWTNMRSGRSNDTR